MDSVRKPGGEMVPHRGYSNRRDLLPAERDLIETLGLSRAEYFDFLDNCYRASKERPAGYELIPDIRNEPISGSTWIVLAIGVALSAAAYLLAPKPSQQQQRDRKSIETGDVNGRRRFTPYENFSSVQELAELGSVIPLIYTRTGVRVTGKLLWSHLESQGSSQLLRAIVLFGQGTTGRPSFKGWAMGDQLLKNYAEARMQLFFSEGNKNANASSNGYGRIQKTDRYSETDEGGWANKTLSDPFQVNDDYIDWSNTKGTSWNPWFSGTRNQSVSIDFGCHSPVPNGHVYKLPYELVLVLDGTGQKQAKEDARQKKAKLKTDWPIYAGLIEAGNTKVQKDIKKVNIKKGDILKYRIAQDEEDVDLYEPHGLSDVNSSTNDRRIEADDLLQLGEIFDLGGNCRAVVINRPPRIWREGTNDTYVLRALDDGQTILSSPDTTNEMPTEVPALMRVQDGLVSNNRDCHITEIGLKSTVWKQITGFANVNSQPSDKVIERYEHNGDLITLGTMSKYITRYSFFKLKCRRLGDQKWVDVCGDQLFAIKGNTPQAKYNSLRIQHSYGQHEFKLQPVPGSYVMKNLGQNANLLHVGGKLKRHSVGGYTVYFNADSLYLNIENLSNAEWIIGRPATGNSGGKIIDIPDGVGKTTVDEGEWGEKDCRFHLDGLGRPDGGGTIPAENYYSIELDGKDKIHKWVYEDKRVKQKTYKTRDPKTVIKGNYRYSEGELKAPMGNIKYYSICREQWIGTRGDADSKGKTHRCELRGKQSGSKNAYVDATEYLDERKQVIGFGFKLVKQGSAYANGELAIVQGIKLNGKNVEIKLTTSAKEFESEDNLNPYDAINDFYKYDAERSSHLDGPENTVVYVNEIRKEDGVGPEYNDMAIAGVYLNSGREFTTFNSLSAYFTEGLHAEDLYGWKQGETKAVNTLPEIAWDLLTNRDYGVGEQVGEDFVDKDAMRKATKYCVANGFRWDGVITDQVSVRDFLYQQAGYCMMLFCCFSGEFSLQPAFPVWDDGRIFKLNSGNFTLAASDWFSRPITVKALFTDGNMRGFSCTFLTPEARQPFQAEVVYREEEKNGFPTTKAINVRLKSRQDQGGDKPGGNKDDPSEAFDMTQFCLSEDHAIAFAKYALRVRTLVDHSVSFETTPEMADGLSPGDFIRITTEYTHFSRFDTGSIDSRGFIQSARGINEGSYPVYYWSVGSNTGVQSATLNVSQQRTLQNRFYNSVFVVKNSDTRDRTYQIEGIEFGEDGFIKLTASHAPTKNGKLLVLDWSDKDFVVSE